MSAIEALILGIVQGLTEFLPVSSSGHLVLGQALLGIEVTGVLFEVSVHVATLLAVLWVYREAVLELARGSLRADAESLRYLGALLVASVPAAAVGLAAGDWLSEGFERPLLAAALLLVTGCIVYTLKWTVRRAEGEHLTTFQALLVGMAQAVAILPGISRSGSTVAAGTALGVRAERVAQFSFLMAVPAIAGAAFLQASDVSAGWAAIGTVPLALAFGGAVVSGIVAIRIFVSMLRHRTFHRFAYYCWTVGALYLIAAAFMPELR